MLRIKEICKAKGITLEALSEKLGIGYQSLHSAMTGNPKLDTLSKIAAALGVSVTELLDAKTDTTINCPHCGKTINIKVEK
jgi:transcriptional regulator with XRE-family HTH domain